MSTESTRSRRAILLAAAGGTAAAVADAIARPRSAIAGPSAVNRDSDNQAVTSTTGIRNSTTAANVFHASTTGLGTAVVADSTHGSGVVAACAFGGAGVEGGSNAGYGLSGHSSSGIGIFGTTSSGAAAIHGEHPAAGVGVEGITSSGSGVYGFSSSKSGVKGEGRIGVQGDVGPTQTAVHGFTGNSAAPVPPAGVGVVAQAQSASLIALHVKGRAKFDRSGVVTVASGASRVTKTLAGVTTSSLVLAVLGQDRAGVWVRAAVPAAGSFKVILNKNVASATKVTYFVLG